MWIEKDFMIRINDDKKDWFFNVVIDADMHYEKPDYNVGDYGGYYVEDYYIKIFDDFGKYKKGLLLIKKLIGKYIHKNWDFYNYELTQEILEYAYEEI